jgi:two-component system, OmpR family, response regulator
MSPRILVVDDEPLIVRNLQAFLEDEGMRVDSVGCAEDALTLVRGGMHFDVCIMDLRLPGIDGDTAIQWLHRLRPALRFLIYTGSSSYTLPDELRALGITELQLFRKPILDMGPLASAIRALAGA